MTTPTDPAYFQRLYAESPDPWRFATSDYERDKYAATIAALGDRRFQSALEVGCSIGVLTRALAQRCDAVLGLDVAEAALVQARAHCADQPGTRFERRVIPAEWPPGTFDLVVFSEVLYYLGDAGIAEAAARTRACLHPQGLVILVNWLGDTGTPCTGDAAAATFIAAAHLPVTSSTQTPQYRLDLLRAPLS